ncbi:MAG: hypothetical protein ACK459_00680 [Akkermansiaceae bacterium]
MGDVDMIRACGMAGVTNELGLSLYRLKYSGDVKEFPKVVNGLLTMVCSRWFDIDGNKTVTEVLSHWLDDICNPCRGRGYAVVPGTPMLGDVPCSACNGTGHVKLTSSDAARWLLDEIGRMEREIAVAIMHRIKE